MRISNKLLSKLQRLQHMEYTVSEIAYELDTPETIVRNWISRLGAPHQKDQSGRVWIIGTELRTWILAQHKKKKGKQFTLAEDEFLCLVCKKPVVVAEPESTDIKPSGLFYKHGKCPDCGTDVYKGGVK